MSEKQQKLVLAIMQFLEQSMQDGTVKQDDSEGLQVAVSCIGEAFGVDLADAEQVKRLSIQPATLSSIFDVYIKTKDKLSSSSASASTSAASTSSGKPAAPSAADKTAAEKFKQTGNQQMSNKQYDAAIESYTKAIDIDSTNPVYFSNRAAAYSSKQDHLGAVADAGKAIEIDPSFSKAYHRLGHAHYSLGDYPAAVLAFENGLKVDPTNANLKSGLANSQARVVPPASTSSADDVEPAAAGMGGMGGMGGMADLLRGLGGGGAGGGGGGMPDISSFLSNPAMMQMAQQMMANGGMERLMNNPTVANMMDRMQTGGGMPSMAEIMSDPNLRDLAGQFMGRGGGAGAPPPGSA